MQTISLGYRGNRQKANALQYVLRHFYCTSPRAELVLLSNALGRRDTAAMKKAIFLVFQFCALSALAQTIAGTWSVLSGTPTPITMSSHPERATQQPLAHEQSLLQTGSYTSAHGERPLWEVAPPPHPTVPLADVARALKKEHATARKAIKVFEN